MDTSVIVPSQEYRTMLQKLENLDNILDEFDLGLQISQWDLDQCRQVDDSGIQNLFQDLNKDYKNKENIYNYYWMENSNISPTDYDEFLDEELYYNSDVDDTTEDTTEDNDYNENFEEDITVGFNQLTFNRL